jgi:uncharacterized phage protein (predicted DNA packaging)
MAISLADVKAELRIKHAHEDTLIARKLSAAQDYVETQIGTKLADIPGGAPSSLEEAVISLACHFYEWRGAATEGGLSSIPDGFQDLLRANRYGRFADGAE